MIAIVEAHGEYEAGAVILERVIDSQYGGHMPHNRIHRVLKSMGLARDEPTKQGRRKWIRYERENSNSLWHAEWHEMKDERWRGQ